MLHLYSVAGLIKRAHAFCAVQLGPGRKFHMYWEFPGGKIKDGELPEECLVRELYDELGIIIEISGEGPLIQHRFHDPDRGEVLMYLQSFYCVCSSFREPQLREHIDIRWGPLDELRELRLTPSDEILLQELLRSPKMKAI